MAYGYSSVIAQITVIQMKLSSDSEMTKYMDRKFSELMSRTAKEENIFMQMSNFNQYDREAGVQDFWTFQGNITLIIYTKASNNRRYSSSCCMPTTNF